jgi:hypothetical protein
MGHQASGSLKNNKNMKKQLVNKRMQFWRLFCLVMGEGCVAEFPSGLYETLGKAVNFG